MLPDSVQAVESVKHVEATVESLLRYPHIDRHFRQRRKLRVSVEP